MAPKTIAIIGGLDYDLIMIANRIPEGGESLLANEYLEALGGKGANSAIATYRTCHKKPTDAYETPIIEARVQSSDEQPENTDKQALEQDDQNEERSYDLEISVRMVGAVGDDKYGRRFYAELNKNGVDSSGVITVPNTQSSICFVMVENYARENRCLFTLGATATWTKEHFLKVEDLGHGLRPDLCVAQMEIHKEVVEQMIETAGKAGIDFLLNAAPANPITKRTYRHLTHLLVNESEAAIMSGRDLDEVNKDTWAVICQEFLNRGVKNVVITLGAKGAYFATASERDHCLAYKVKVVDTTGAGDTFTGAYASEYLRQKETGQWDIRKAVVRANKAAALTITHLGAQQGIPWANEIDRFNAPFNDPDISNLTISDPTIL
ncbi:Ribokinase-like protein [Lophiotrema nucula]|uniref:Ribokinase n=1 Tax=Lophiotrema nucula TaxID=690887 RepID=A0A6A5Z775_9PLEO|nr:Ribokinase-like protein [Lophiotrema nucula]